MTRLRLLLLAALTASASAGEDSVAVGLDRAVDFFEGRVKRDPEDFIAANQLSDRLLRRARWGGRIGDVRRAEEVAELSLKAVAADLNPGGLAAKAQALHALHRFAEAAELARQLESALPGKALPQQLLGDAQLELGDHDGAANAFAEALRRSERDAGSEYRASRIAWFRGDLDGAAKHLETVVELAPADSPELRVWALLQRGELAFRRGQHDAAEKDYLAALAIAPHHWSVLEHLAELRGAQGHDVEATQLFEQAVHATGRPELWQALGDLHAFYKHPIEAAAAHQRALAGYRASLARGEVLYVHHLAGFFSDSQEDAAQAVEFAQQDLRLRSTAAAWDALAWAQYRAGDFTNALASSAKATGLADAHVLYHAAMIRLSSGAISEGQALLRRCAEVNPHFAGFHIHR